jgi:hypothetical protein
MPSILFSAISLQRSFPGEWSHAVDAADFSRKVQKMIRGGARQFILKPLGKHALANAVAQVIADAKLRQLDTDFHFA